MTRTIMANHKIPTCILVFLSLFFCCATAAISIEEIPIVEECPGDNHWPLTQIESGKLKDRAFLKDGVVSGAGVNDELGVLSLNGSGHVIFDGFGEDCLTKPDRCPNGFTLSFWFKYGGLISSILGLNATYHAALDSWLLPLVPKKSRWLPCYRASQDGWTGAIFHQKCDGKSSTLTIIKVQDFVFGGYLSETWGPSKNGSIVDSKAFLFSLNNPRGTAPRKLTLIQSMFGIVNTAATTTPTSLPTFGDSDLVLKDNANTVAQSYSSPGQNYKLESGLASVSQDLFTDTKYFIVDEIEVFYNEELTTDQAYILTTGAENPETTGFAIFHNQTLSNGSGDMVVKVSTEAKTWTLKATDKSKDFRPMTVTWHPTQGLKLYENTQLMASGLAVPSSNTNKKTSILLGHSESTSNPHSGQNIQIRALAIWRTVITVKDMNTYNNVACAPLTDDASNSFSWNRTVSGTPTPLTGPNTVISPARWFSSDNYINIASQSCFATVKLNLSSLNVFTACWWFRHDSAVSKYLFAIRSSSGIQLDVGAAATTTWQHFCLKHTFEQKTGCHKQLYLNGRSTSDNSYTSSCQSMAGPPITVLIGLYTTKTFDGLLSNFKLWDRHLSASEISLVSNGCSMIAGNLIVWEVLLSKFEPPVSMARDGLCKREISYIESSYPQKKGQNVRLLTSEYVPVTINCLYFQYNFYGKDIGRLNVYLLKGNSHESLVWSLAGDQGTNEWRSVYIPLNNTEKTKVIFEGIVGDGYLGDLSIGNVALTTTDSCEGGTGKNYIAVTGIRSNIIGHLGDYMQALQTWLASAGLPSSWKTCYRLSRTGWITSNVLHKNCANRGPTITIIRHSDNVFGGVFDQSWSEYGKCSETSIPSNKAFLFSLKSNAGSNTRLAIKSSASHVALSCVSYQQSFPNFGKDLVVNLESKNVKGTFGQTYGSTAGSFLNGQETFEPSDIEILIPQATFCSSTCPEASSCDEIQGKCACDKSSRFFESCSSGIFLDNFTSDAYDFFPMEDPLNIKNLKRPTWGEVNNTTKLTKGLGKPAISTSEADYMTIGSTHACLTNPTSCNSGVTVSIWLKYSNSTSSKPVYLFCSDSCKGSSTGISIVLTDPANEKLNITVTTQNKQCSHPIPFGPNVWTHIVFTWTTDLAMYINGQQVSHLSSTCISDGSYSANTAGGVVIGRGAAVDVDDFIVWPKQLDLKLVESLYDFYKGRKNMTLDYKFKTSSILQSADKELNAYKRMCHQVQAGVKGLLSAELASKVIIENCLLSPLTDNSGTEASVSIVYYGMSGYSVAKPLMERLKIAKTISALPVTDVLILNLQTVYSTPCQLSVSSGVTTASLSWSCPQAEPDGGILSEYELNVTNTETGTTESLELNSGNLFYTVKDLLPETRYNLTVTAVTLEGAGAASEPVTCTTKSRALVAPYNVTSLNQTGSTIYIYWNFSTAELSNIEGFRIKYKTMDAVFIGYINIPSNLSQADLRGLNCSTVYQIAVQSYKTNSNGPFSAILNASTTDGIPDAAPESVQGSTINATSVTVKWSPFNPDYADGVIIGYHIESYIANGENAGGNFSSRMICNTSTTLHNLYPFTDYYVNVSAFTFHGIGPAIQVFIPNQPTVPKIPLTSVSTSEIQRTAINIAWGPVPEGSSLVPITGYMVWYREHLPSPSSSLNITIQINNSMSCLIEGLKDYTKYEIRVAAINRAGVGVYSPQMVERTAEGHPRSVVSNATTSHMTRNSSIIQWNPLPPSDLSGVLAGYTINIYDVLRKVNVTRMVCGNTTSTQLSDLFPYTEYLVYISGFTKGGEGNTTLVTSFFTLEAAPNAPPQNVTSRNTSSVSIELTWSPPPITNINGKLRGYCITWFKTFGDGQEIFNKTIDIQPSARRRKRSVSDRTLQTLTLSGLEKFTMYTIRILGFTIANGVFFETNTTTAEDVPNVPPPNITASNSSSTSMFVSWQPIPVESRHGVFLGYHVLYQEGNQMSSTPLAITVNHSVLNVELNNLKKFTGYVVFVAGFTTPGTGNLSSSVNVTTDEDVPDEAPVSLAGTALSITKLSFTWQPVASDKHNGIILGYTLALNLMNTSLAKTVVINNASILTTEVAGLLSWTNYTAKINAFTIKGPGPWSPGVLVTTLEELPLPPTTVTAIMLSSTTINVTWSLSNTTFLRGILRGYRLTFTPRGPVFPNIPYNVTTSVNTLSTVLTGLQEFTEYDITVAGFTIGDGNQSQSVIAKTDSAPPSAGPNPLGLLDVTPNSITLQLGSVPPEDSNGVITGYKVLTTAVGSSDPPRENLYGPTATIAVVNGLMPYTQYLFQVFAYTDKGWGVPSNTTLRSGETAPGGQPSYDDENKRFSTDSIPLQWEPLTIAQANGEVLGYRVSYQLVSLGEEPVEDAPINEFDVTGTSTVIKNLELYGGYKITIAAFTAKGFGPPIILYGETCRCRKTLYANWRVYSPYVEISPETGELEGIFPEMVKRMTEECCQKCVAHNESVVDFTTSLDGSPAHKPNEDDLKTNISEDVDFSFPLFGTKDQKTYTGGFGYRALIETPGIVYVVNIDTEDEGPHMTIIRSLLGCLPYISLTVLLAFLAGFVLWILDRKINSELFPLTFIKGTYEGLWWAFITMTTLGYGDRFPKSFWGKAFAINWMLSGIIIYGILSSLLQTAVTTIAISFDTKFNGKQVVAIHNSPEFRFGQRLNIPMNKEIQPRSFQEVYNALIEKKAYGAFLDAYAIGQQKHLFEHPTLKFVKIYDFRSAYGIVLGGTSWRLRTCFYRYLRSKRVEVFERITKYTKFVEAPPEDLPRTVEYSSGLFTANTNSFNYTLFTLLGFWFFLMMLGCVYEFIRRKMTKVKDEKLETLDELKRDIQEFVDNMKKIEQQLRERHKQQLIRWFKKYEKINEKGTIKTLKNLFT